VAHLLTGVLLVGGASARFGSPKALARLVGETLAERGWRVLAEACDEVLAVGKTADGLQLPFPLLDDGTEERAPVFGVIAGLRTARHEVCVMLPVDNAAVTPKALRALGEAVAVPQTGPLPGAYEEGMLRLLEERVARGELSLRGVNPRVLELDAALLADVDTPADLERLAALQHSVARP
jgi:molybdopterin-guanine dinucleotide biosynthesis protein A